VKSLSSCFDLEVVLGLVEDRLVLEYFQDPISSVQGLSREHEVCELVDIEVGSSSLLLEEL